MTGWWGPGSPKEQFLWQLHDGVGHPFPLSVGPPFRFDAGGNRWRNLDQLEAVVEFYMNFTEPWGGGAPRKPGDSGYVTVNLRDPRGQNATVGSGAVVTLDGGPDLSGIIPNPANNPPAGAAAGGVSPANYPPRLKFLYDMLWLQSDTARPSKLYRVMAVDDQAKTVTLDARPTCPGNTSAWQLIRRPSIVVIDPIGARARGAATLAGTHATVARTDPADPNRTVLLLDGAAAALTGELRRINVGFDTIHLAADTVTTPSRPGPVYRIVAADPAAREVTVEGAPTLESGSSAWQIPAGVVGVQPRMDYDLGPQFAPNPASPMQQSRGYDHYDALLFLVHRGRVEGRQPYRWSTYTSRVYGTWSGGNWQQSLSSLAGNARYHYSAYYSDDNFKNFTFAVVDATPTRNGFQPVATDSIAAARFYTGTPAPPAPAVPGNPDQLDPRVWLDNAPPMPGKRLIRLHRGNRGARYGSGSAGCMVAPDYIAMRTDLLSLFERDYAEYHGPNTFDVGVRRLLNATTPQASTNLWTPGGPGPDLAPGDWTNKVVGSIWVVRPDERPVTGP